MSLKSHCHQNICIFDGKERTMASFPLFMLQKFIQKLLNGLFHCFQTDSSGALKLSILLKTIIVLLNENLYNLGSFNGQDNEGSFLCSAITWLCSLDTSHSRYSQVLESTHTAKIFLSWLMISHSSVIYTYLQDKSPKADFKWSS